ncbi:divergent polysaccharide deacetylase family protein [Alkalilacustris brevis]|uniref:divergent polysaccharide deacetylase family protein n=1 Tax=Alkalilacustris brevis TaxID=2026338 RepID=UPI000E0D8721|nr:divergent polysaccharide deacetylase family protein [Alkalilacustris brevis]
MAKGLIAGFFWGAVLSAAALAVAAALLTAPRGPDLAGQPDMPPVEAPDPAQAPDPAEASDPAEAAPSPLEADPAADTPAGTDAPDAPAVPSDTLPEPDATTEPDAIPEDDAAPKDDAAPGPAPQLPDSDAALAAPAPAPGAAPAPTGADTPATSGQAGPLVAPSAEPAPGLPVDAAPAPPPVGIAGDPALDTGFDMAGEIAPGLSVSEGHPPAVEAPAAATPAPPESTAPGNGSGALAQPPGIADPTTPAGIGPDPEAPAAAPPGGRNGSGDPQPLAEGPASASLPAPEAPPAAPGIPAPPEDEEEAHAAVPPQVLTDRLPRIGDTPEPETAAPAEEELAHDPAELPALQRHAVDFENPEDRPLFAVLLLDDGIDADERANLARLPFPVTFVIDAAAPDAEAAARVYRAGGKEVVLLPAPLSPEPSAEALAQALRRDLAQVPEAVAVIDRPEDGGGFQNNRLLAQEAVALLGEDGHGLVTFDRGLNAAAQLARSAGLGEALVFRTLDAEDENVPTIRRYLDRAVFRAAQVSAVVVLGRAARADTIAGLLEWRMEGRADAVALAPLSAVLLADTLP